MYSISGIPIHNPKSSPDSQVLSLVRSETNLLSRPKSKILGKLYLSPGYGKVIVKGGGIVRLSVHLSGCLRSVQPSVCPSVCLSVCFSVCVKSFLLLLLDPKIQQQRNSLHYLLQIETTLPEIKTTLPQIETATLLQIKIVSEDKSRFGAGRSRFVAGRS